MVGSIDTSIAPSKPLGLGPRIRNATIKLMEMEIK